jgi:hypothetical protein
MKTKPIGRMKVSILIIFLALSGLPKTFSQMAGVPIYRQRSEVFSTNLFSQIQNLQTN